MADITQLPKEPENATMVAEREWRLGDLASVLYRRRWIAITTFLLAAAVVMIYTLSVTPIYEAHAQLLIDDKPSLVTFQGNTNSHETDRGSLETHYRLLRSRTLAERVIDELKLWNAPDLASNEQNPSADSPGLAGHTWNWIAGVTGRQAKAPTVASPVPAIPSSASDAKSLAIDRLLARLRVTPVHQTRIIEVGYESSDPELAARIVNALAATYIKYNQETRSQASKEATAWLTEQLAEQRRKVEASELAVQQYRERENSLSLDPGQNIVTQRLNALNASVTQAKTDLITVEALYRRLAASQNNPEALETFAPIRSNSLVQSIRTRLTNLHRERMQLSDVLGAKHPDMVRIDAAITVAEQELTLEVAKTVESVRQEYLAAAAREKELTAALNSQKASALALNRQGIAYSVLLREVESNREIYQNLLQRTNEAEVASDRTATNIEVVDAAQVPRRPTRPDTRSSLLIGLLLSAVIGIATAFVWEGFDTRIQTPNAVKTELGLPLLGMLPYVSSRALKGRSLLLTSGVPPSYAEAFRGLRTNVLASAGGKGNRSILITSAAPEDGKSVVAVNLALALGKSGSSVLLIDADLRRPVLHTLLNREQRFGLSEVLLGTHKPSEAIVQTRHAGVWLLPCGAGVPNPSEQLGSKRFKEFLKKLGESFDWIIIDSPPVMAVTDPAVIAPLTSGVILVVNARRTRQRVAEAALDRLEAAGATFTGAVLNAITVDRDHYYNSRYYLPFYAEYHADKRSA